MLIIIYSQMIRDFLGGVYPPIFPVSPLKKTATAGSWSFLTLVILAGIFSPDFPRYLPGYFFGEIIPSRIPPSKKRLTLESLPRFNKRNTTSCGSLSCYLRQRGWERFICASNRESSSLQKFIKTCPIAFLDEVVSWLRLVSVPLTLL